MEKGKKRAAVLVGCNYPNTINELHGCINDVLSMRDTLTGRFGFDLNHIELLIDDGVPNSVDDRSSKSKVVTMPTGANIKKALNQLIDEAEPGDILFFHFSGHGTRIPPVVPGLHPSKQDEAIVPCDFNLITDVDMRQLVNRVPKGASFTILSDSCHSGGLIDKEKEQIGPSTNDHHETNIINILTGTSKLLQHKPKTIPLESILQHLTSMTNINTSDIGTHLLESFGEEASLRFRLSLTELQDLCLWGPPAAGKPREEDDGILLSGCQANETSADVSAMEGGNTGRKAYGAFSNSVQMVLSENKSPLSNREVVLLARTILKAQKFVQHPCLYCSDDNVGATFLLQPPN